MLTIRTKHAYIYVLYLGTGNRRTLHNLPDAQEDKMRHLGKETGIRVIIIIKGNDFRLMIIMESLKVLNQRTAGSSCTLQTDTEASSESSRNL
jgi:hypothetical protein